MKNASHSRFAKCHSVWRQDPKTLFWLVLILTRLASKPKPRHGTLLPVDTRLKRYHVLRCSSRDAKVDNSQKFVLTATVSATPQDLFLWFDETAPVPGAPLFEVVATARAYDSALEILRKARRGNTSLQAGTSVLDSGYDPATVNLDSWQEYNPNAAPSLFYWQGEEVSGATQVIHFQMTKRAYEQMLELVAGSDLRLRPSRSSNQAHWLTSEVPKNICIWAGETHDLSCALSVFIGVRSRKGFWASTPADGLQPPIRPNLC